MALRIIAAVIAAVLTSAASPASAATSLRETAVANAVGTPAVLSGARVRIYNWRGGTILDLCVARDAGSRAIKMLRYHIEGFTPFDEPAGVMTVQDDDKPPVSRDMMRPVQGEDGVGRYVEEPFTKCFSIFPNATSADATRYVVTVDAVAFLDGSVWRAPPPRRSPVDNKKS